MNFKRWLLLSEMSNFGKIRLWRASDFDDVFAGMSLGEELETAILYTKNSGFGGETIYYADVNLIGMKILNINSYEDLCDELGMDRVDCNLYSRVGGTIAQAIPQLDDVREELVKRGYDWVVVAEDYPEGTTTWQPISEKAVASIDLQEYELA
jgi:hypothetical protein